METDARAAAAALTRRARFVDLTTLAPDGYPETRTVFNLRVFRAEALAAGPAAPRGDFATYLGTNASSRKLAHIRRDGRVCLYYADHDSFEGCLVRGRISETADPAVRAAVWTDDWAMYYPGGRDGGDFALLAFVPELVRYYHGLSVAEFDA
jgi:hypothetical protein